MSDLNHLTTATAAPVIGHPGTASSIDLQQFCGADDYRPHLHKPFRYKGHVYATDGRILIRVDDSEAYEACDKIAVEQVLKLDEPRSFLKVPEILLPPKPPIGEVECRACDGRGYEHDCPDCDCECDICDGSGKVKEKPEVSADFVGQLFDIEYLRLLYTLPDLEVAQTTADAAFSPLFFRFAGGVGAVMPLSRKYAQHVDISPRQTASALMEEERAPCP